MSSSRKLNILVAPLDWGLGHTTRCVPIIAELLKKGATVWLAGNETQKKILTEVFPGCIFLPLEGYNVKYSNTNRGFVSKMMRQLPDILSAVKAENRWLKEMVVAHNINGVISDNRFGMYHLGLPSVFITHQLQIKTGMGKLADIALRMMNYQRIRCFTACWVPDFEEAPNLAGALSHPSVKPKISTHYIGPLSRVKNNSSVTKDKLLLFVLSGPEPQRTIFEQMIFAQVENEEYRAVIVRGLPLSSETPVIKNATIYNHLPKEKLESLMQRATFIFCRSGYSSIMDINAMMLKSILIPTPGQTEQEYLGRYLMEEGFAISGNQNNFNLADLLDKASQFNYDGFIQTDGNGLSVAIDSFLQDCSERGIKPR